MLKEIKADLHIHTCLSPCGDTDMTPAMIVKEAKSKGFRFPDFFIQSYFGQPSSEIVEKFIKDIKHGENGEFLLHIGRGDYKSEYNRKKHWGIRGRSLRHREAELDTLLDMKKNNLFHLLAEENVELVNYGLV